MLLFWFFRTTVQGHTVTHHIKRSSSRTSYKYEMKEKKKVVNRNSSRKLNTLNNWKPKAVNDFRTVFHKTLLRFFSTTYFHLHFATYNFPLFWIVLLLTSTVVLMYLHKWMNCTGTLYYWWIELFCYLRQVHDHFIHKISWCIGIAI